MQADFGPASRTVGTALAVRPCTLEDEAAIVELHARGFGRPWPVAHWRWRSTRSPAGGVQAVGAFAADGRCLALFAGVSLECRWQGRAAQVISGSDSLVDPELRRSLRLGPTMHAVVAGFFRHFGFGRALFMYGCPVASLVRLMTGSLRVEVLADVHALVREVAAATPPPQLAVTPLHDCGPEVDALEHACLHRHDGLRRGAGFLAWRFHRHPTVAYRTLAVRGPTGTLRGLAVLRDGGWHDASVSIAEWLVPDDDDAAGASLLAAAAAEAHARGRPRLVTVFSPNAPPHRAFQCRHGFYVHPTSHQLVYRSFHQGLTRSALFDRWRLTMGDLEFL